MSSSGAVQSPTRTQGETVIASAAPAEPAIQSRWGVLRHTHFRNVWASQFVSNVGGWMEMLGIQMIVAHATGSLKMLGYLAAAQLVPILLLGTLGGLVADRVNRRSLLIWTQLMLMAVAAGVTAASWLLSGESSAHQLVAVLMVLSILNGIVMAFNMPAWQVLTPRLVPKEELTRAITLNGLQFNLSRVVGPALAGLMMGWYGATPLFIVNTLSFLAVVLTVRTTPDAPAPPRTGVKAAAQILEATSFVFHQRGPLAIFAAMVLMSALAAPLARMLPLYVIDVYGLSESAADKITGLLTAVLGIGAVLGGLMLRYIPTWYPKHHFIPMAVAGAGLTITMFSFTTTLTQGFVAMFFCGIFWIWAFNQSWAAMQNLVPDRMRGRVMAVSNVAAFGATAVGNLAAGFVGESLTRAIGAAMATQVAVGGLSSILLAAGIFMLLNRVPEVDGHDRLPASRLPRRSLVHAVMATEHRPR